MSGGWLGACKASVCMCVHLTDITNAEAERCILGVAVHAHPSGDWNPETHFPLENYKYQTRPLRVRWQCTVRFVLVHADCALSRWAKVHRRTLTRPPHTSDPLRSPGAAPPPGSGFRHPLSGPPPPSQRRYRTPGAGPLVSTQANDCQISPMSPEDGLSSTITDWLFINSWWLLLPFIMLLVVAAFIVAFVLLLYMISPLISPKPLKLNGAHVVVSAAGR